MNAIRKYSLGIICMAISFVSCEKVIDINLNDQDPQIVVEGNITNQPGPYTVSLTKTVNFSSSNEFPPVQQAIVKISDGTITEQLTEVSPGLYQTQQIVGTEGKTYVLLIETGGKTITAQSTMPAAVNLDSITFIQSAFASQTNPEYIPIPHFKDPATPGNFYRFKQRVNDTIDKSFLVDSDVLINGLAYQRPIFSQGVSMRAGDSLHLEFQCIDKPLYTYFTAINANASTTPANPTSNVVSALGFFSAHTTQLMHVKVE